ncbi:glycine betaine ABC transporter substrate-binding protein [Peribacillus deserti]|uniref:Osmoprotectant ABC transporter substrate-binding protein n=1 Tax=Peribacillus deserti TaxID=673318 RepID=A0A2N5M2J1_9BACI|nr:glycine betaine ABC transporter substrate-binding protein [Peribacillus deserti]PLT28579.1 osmoprotectant ABC transporter substrate-binding protein [Peribacillus deserti]
MRKASRLLLAISLVSIFLLSACSQKEDTINIGAATYTETKIMAAVYKELIEDRTDIQVDITPDLLSTSLILKALDRGDLDMSLMYSGMIYNNFFPVKVTTNREEVLSQAKKGFDKYYDMKWFDPLGFENTYALTVREDIAEQRGLEKISDLKKSEKNMKFGVDSSWMERPTDGYPAFKKAYGVTFERTYPMDVNLVYEAAASKKMDVVLAYSTDPRLIQYKLKTLKDDKRFFPPYDASILARNDTLKKHPELKGIINTLSGKINEKTMTNLNYQVDIKHRSERDVAREYLVQQGLLDKEKEES